MQRYSSQEEKADAKPNLKIVKSEVKPSGEAIQVIRPVATTKESSEEIVKRLISQYGVRTEFHPSQLDDFNMVKAAFPNVADQILNSYDGAHLAADSKQDLVGERYLAEQIKQINEENKKKSILDKWSHLLYEGEDERNYVSSSSIKSPTMDYANYKPVKSTTFNLNSYNTN